MFSCFLKEKPNCLLPALSFPKAGTLFFSFGLFKACTVLDWQGPLCWYSLNGEVMFKKKNGDMMLNFLSPPRELPPASASLYLAWYLNQPLSKSQSNFPPTPIFLQTLLTLMSHCHHTHCPGTVRACPRAPAYHSPSLGTLTSLKTSFGSSPGTSLWKQQEILKKRPKTAKE